MTSKRQLGAGGPMVHRIGLGCMSLAGAYGNASEAEGVAVLEAAVAAGVDFLDTANVYGMGLSEEIVGRFLKSSGARVVLATKGGIRNENGKRWFDNSADHLRQALEASLKRLGRDQVDLYYIHRRDPSVPIEAVMETLLTFKAEGKIGGIGFSEIAPASLRRAVAVGPVMAVQSEYSLWSRLPELGMIQATRELGVALVPYSPVARGFLSDRPPERSGMSAGDFRLTNPRFEEPNLTANRAYLTRFQALARARGVSTAALAMAWVLARGEHLIPIPGTRSPAHLAELLAGDAIALSADDMAAIEQVLPVGWAHGDRYSDSQSAGPERYC